jgi:hypothetical protein
MSARRSLVAPFAFVKGQHMTNEEEYHKLLAEAAEAKERLTQARHERWVAEEDFDRVSSRAFSAFLKTEEGTRRNEEHNDLGRTVYWTYERQLENRHRILVADGPLDRG